MVIVFSQVHQVHQSIHPQVSITSDHPRTMPVVRRNSMPPSNTPTLSLKLLSLGLCAHRFNTTTTLSLALGPFGSQWFVSAGGCPPPLRFISHKIQRVRDLAQGHGYLVRAPDSYSDGSSRPSSVSCEHCEWGAILSHRWFVPGLEFRIYSTADAC